MSGADPDRAGSPAPPRSGVWHEWVVVGRIARSHGNRGQVMVDLETDFPEDRFRPGAIVYVRRGADAEPLRVGSMRLQRGRAIVGLEGVSSIDEADRLADLELRVPPDELPELPRGVYYRHDLVGCVVLTVGGERVGDVTLVDGAGGESRLVVGAGSAEVLVPLAEAICVDIDLPGRRIVIDPPAGLLDLNRRP